MIESKTSHVKRGRQTVRDNYNRMSHWYDLFAGSEKRFTDLGLRLLIIQPGEKVLEIGFGTGHSLVEFAQAVGGSGKVYGIDISDGMYAAAHSRVQRAGLVERVDLQLGDAASLPFANSFFDAVFISFTLELFDTLDIPVVLGECKRVLRKGGRIGIVAMAEGDSLAVRLYEWAHARIPTLLDCRPIPVREMVSGAGFLVTETAEMSMWGLPVNVITARKL